MSCKIRAFMIFYSEYDLEGEFERCQKKNPECPLYNPLNCKEYYNPKLCAFVRKDRVCLKKKKPKSKTKEDSREDSTEERDEQP